MLPARRDGDEDRGESKGQRAAEGILDAGKEIREQAREDARAALDRMVRQNERPERYDVPSFRRGGKMRKSGLARLHKGERVRGRSGKR